ncbi:ubiquitin carboxyl-terminal hydrolase 43-like [Haliotis asinina]|uniref:ubiquitin carboxyl-terminal hydrolase 43-like n=1 Tax=Haliotis asinina TaxID=109174 RepID=UPI00353211F1
MSETIPGGRQRASSEGDILDDDDDDSVYSTGVGAPLNSGHRKVSTSALLTTVDRRSQREDYYSDVPEERRTIGPSERRSKSRKTSFKSIKKLMNRVMKSSSSASSIHEQDPSSRVTWTPTLRRRNDNFHDAADLRGSRRGKHEKSESTSRPLITDPNFTGPKWDKTPGTVGLNNHGNTCFMNAILQCLGNTDSFVEYFVDGVVKEDLRNLRNIRKGAIKADVTEHLAVLLKCLWSNRYSAEVSRDFKSIVGKANHQYEGSSQHDAQEFLLWLLDRLHEDLNSNIKKKNKPLKNTAMRSDEELANEALLSSQGSFVSHLFKGLHRSSLTCPHCGKHSNTFDPYLCVSLPLPQKCPRPVFVNVVYSGQKQLKIGLRMNTFESVRDLRHRISKDIRIPASEIVLCQMSEEGFRTTYGDDQPLSDIPETETVYAFETLPDNDPASASSRYETPFIHILLVHVEKSTSPQGLFRFCSPCVLRVPRDFTYKRLQKEILHYMGDAVKPEALSQKSVLFNLQVVDCHPSKAYLPLDVEMPLYSQAVDRVMTYYGEDYGPVHVKLMAEWDTQIKEAFVVDDDDNIDEHTSVHHLRISQHLSPTASLDECFKLYTQEEKLSGDDAWLCPHCKKQQQGTIKTLGLWSLPDVLVIHLKRFKQVGMRRNKLNTLVNFPVGDLNMTEHVVQRDDMQNGHPGHKLTSGKDSTVGRDDDMLYDLFAVCNHYGNMNGGHYTAFCKNPIDGQWHEYDDTRVKDIPQSQVTSKAAYLLFYQRRSLSKCCNQNLHTGKHWIFRLYANNNNNNNNNHVPPSPSSPTSAKSVHFDTSSPQQIPRHSQPMTPNTLRREMGEHPIKPILRPLTPQPPRRQNYSPQEVDYYDHSPTSRGREVTQEFRVRAPLVRQHSEPEAHKGMGACFSINRNSGHSGDAYGVKSPQLAEKHSHSSNLLNGHDHESGTFRRSHRSQERTRHNVCHNANSHRPLRPPTDSYSSRDSTDSPNHPSHITSDSSSHPVRAVNGSGYLSSPNESPSHSSRASSDLRQRPSSSEGPVVVSHTTQDKMSVMVAESKQIVPPSPVMAAPLPSGSRALVERRMLEERRLSEERRINEERRVSEEKRLSEERTLVHRDINTIDTRTSGSARNSEDRDIPEKFATIGRDIQMRIDALMDQTRNTQRPLADNNMNTYSRPPRPHTVQRRQMDGYAMEPRDRDNMSISSLSQRQSRSRSNIDARDNMSVKSFGDQVYNGYGRRDSSRGPVRYRPHIHKGNMHAQMQARRSIEVPAPCLKESSV